MQIKLSSELVKSSLSGHSWVGLLLGAFMYLICLSGTLAVFYEEIERWEQPIADEYHSLDPKLLQASFNRYLQELPELTEHMYLVFPNEVIPRIKFSSDTEGFYLNADGSFGELAYDDWSHLITALHINLHLPINIGVLLVSAIGVLFLGLIISGFLSHPNILKDAFSWRRDKSWRMAETDLHNRLSVWGAPFHIMIALTGAYFGIAGLLIIVAAQAFYGGDQAAVTAKFFAPEPELSNQSLDVNIEKPLAYIDEYVPDGKLLLMIIHDAPTENRFQEYFVQYPNRLIYSENFRFDMAGNFIDRAGYFDGSAASQVVYSIYRLHFGHFGGISTKILYFILGVALTVVSVSGINIWLEKRKKQDYINTTWAGLVWGVPLALGVSAFTQVILQIPSTFIFWGVCTLSCLLGFLLQDQIKTAQWLKIMSVVVIGLLLLSYVAKFGVKAFSPAALNINLMFFASAAIILFLAMRKRQALACKRVCSKGPDV